MKLIEMVSERLARRRFPRKKRDFWYCGKIYNYCYELQQAGKPWRTRELVLPCEVFLINPFSDSGGKVPKVGDILPCIRLDGWIGFYEVTEEHYYSSPGSDFASWDNGKKATFVLHHCERAS